MNNRSRRTRIKVNFDLQLKPEHGSGQSERMALTGDDKTNCAIQLQQQQQQETTTTAVAPALSFAFNVCPPSPESSPTRAHLPGMNNLPVLPDTCVTCDFDVPVVCLYACGLTSRMMVLPVVYQLLDINKS